MRHITFLLSTFFCMFFFPAGSHGQSNVYEAIQVKVSEEGKPYILHKLRSGETIYRLTKMYGVSQQSILDANPDISINDIKESTLITIPLDGKDFETRNHKLDPGVPYMAIYYEVRQKETQYSIARRYFSISQKDLRKNNQLDKSGLDMGQVLFIGWMQTSQGLVADPPALVGPEEQRENEEVVYYEIISGEQNEPTQANIPEELIDDSENYEILTTVAETKVKKRFVFENGVAFWNKKQSNKGGLYVLHDSATVGSFVEIENPMFGKKITAKVIGKIPKETYRDDVVVVVSPMIAHKLGALDERFYVKMRYLQAINTTENR